MKKLEFKTSNGKFLLICVDTLTDEYRQQALINGLNNFIGLCIDDELFELIDDVKHMTEEQFAEVVDSTTWRYTSGGSDTVYRNYLYNSELSGSGILEKAKDSFDSLIRSLGWYLWENPYGNFADEIGCQEVEFKTLYNPVLLKKV